MSALLPLYESGARGSPEYDVHHGGIANTFWALHLITNAVTRAQWRIDVDELGRPAFIFTQPIPRTVVPWMPLPNDIASVPFFEAHVKLAAMAWNLPSGAPSNGGSCPAAQTVQSTVDPAAHINIGADPKRSICQRCYAPSMDASVTAVFHVASVMRQRWVSDSMRGGKSGEAFVKTMVWAIREARIHLTQTSPAFRPFRVHGTGDFFTPPYAYAWARIANGLPEHVFFAPTRTWLLPAWERIWPDVLARVTNRNLVVRPAAMHQGDVPPRVYPLAAGAAFEGSGDWTCPAYGTAQTCQTASCRVCWLEPAKSVDFRTAR